MLTGTYLLQSDRHRFSKEIGSPICRHCGLENEDITHMLLKCPSLINQRRQFYSNVKSLVIEHIGVNLWKSTFTNTENIVRLILDCSRFENLFRDTALVDITRATTELCYSLRTERLRKTEGCK